MNASKMPGALAARKRFIESAVERLEEMPDSCSLDVADRGENTYTAIAELLAIDRERARQIGERGLKRARTRGEE